ncbi:OB-fold nucleic acid binding domain-containing protein [Streptomyces sp. RS10V-4]|uniref:helicase-related protein n=1 Tax=Streptomyces rhizoryzae TaxID=2932493 RepID=UPI0020031FD7|nr:helicase-related protein [Streptomyces rhizoryzae]MCK7627068.1 OB-fold nucleic acid binding domain-containing protein [Streptomyces rhizoryzae]
MERVAALDEPLKKILGGTTAKVLGEHLGLETVGDLLHHYPRRYAERGELTRLADLPLDEHVTVVARVADARVLTFNQGRGKRLEVTLTDGSGRLQLVFFGKGVHKPHKDLLPGRSALFAGKVSVFNRRLQLAHPEYQLLDQDADSGAVDAFAGKLLPLYPACQQMPSWKIAKAVDAVLPRAQDAVDPLPEALRAGRGLVPLTEALLKIHRPATKADIADARARLKWDEAFVLQVALARRRFAETQLPAVPRKVARGGILDAFDARLPFTLTEGQRKVSQEIFDDLATEHPMHRLLQGEVGSGKAQPLDALVLTPRGFRPMGEMAVGTEVVVPSGATAPVDGVFPQGEREVWRLVLSDGSTVECDDEHLWIVSSRATGERVLTTRELRTGLLDEAGRPRWSIAPAVPVDLDDGGPRPVDAAALGRTLGAGGTGPAGRTVPAAYRNAPVKDRRALLRGLLASGGPAGRPGVLRTDHAPLAADAAWLARSLGGTARTAPLPGGGHEVTVALPGADGAGDGGAAFRRTVTAIEPAGRRPVQCISVAHPSRAYVTDHFTVTHNTMVALRAMLGVVDSGGQAAMLAPTEVLAQQHHRSITGMMGDLAEGGLLGGAEQGTKVVLLTGSMGAAARRRALLDLVTGEAGIVIGTHALIEDVVQFHDLGLVVVDEQHRFGVEQRDALRSKGKQPPHLLVMTATPIPRTVAMTVFGDLETSVLDQLPAGRSPIASHVVPAKDKPHFLARAWERVREEVAAGHQAYVVCPRIGDDEDTPEAKGAKGNKAKGTAAPPGSPEDAEEKRPPLAVLEIAEQLRTGPLAGLRVAVLHGRMPPDDKDEVMRRFAAGELDVLVATTVIEVGVNVPNATVMVIMDADRFGVSQLHQLRGRVGRGSAPGLCLLVSEMPEASPARARLAAVAATLDGFELSRIDLEQRREGDVLGQAQSGVRSSLRMLAVIEDEEVIAAAREEATALVAADPALTGCPELRTALAALLDEDREQYLDKG